jgi:SWI/SNF-related matrix-associated actin-dependent regulator of chromatin subfamily A3
VPVAGASRSSSPLVLGSNNSSRLDLTAANRVHLMEPQWNPMAEEQALDRVYRLGQTREVLAIRYITKDSIEEVST